MYYLSVNRSLSGLGAVTLLIFCLVKFGIGTGFGMSLANMKSDSRATINETSNILQQNPSNYDAYTRRGYAHYTLFEGDLALADYNQALAIMPSAKLYKMRADAYAVMGKTDLAEQDRLAAANFKPHP